MNTQTCTNAQIHNKLPKTSPVLNSQSGSRFNMSAKGEIQCESSQSCYCLTLLRAVGIYLQENLVQHITN